MAFPEASGASGKATDSTRRSCAGLPFKRERCVRHEGKEEVPVHGRRGVERPQVQKGCCEMPRDRSPKALPLLPVRRGFGASSRRQGATGTAAATGETLFREILTEKRYCIPWVPAPCPRSSRPHPTTCQSGTILIITTNLLFSEWVQVLGDANMTTAMLVRITHHCNIIETRNDSYRSRYRK
jgi:DNA replication protein